MADEKVLDCVFCGKTERIMKRCCRCRKTFYCSRECQKLDWMEHKTNCTVQKMEGDDKPRSHLINNVIESKTGKCVVETRPDVTNHLVKTAEQITNSHDCKVDGEVVIATGGDLCVNFDESPCHHKRFDQLQIEQSEICVRIKYAKVKHKVQLTIPCSSVDAFKAFSRAIRVPVEKLKVIHKGKLQTEANIAENLKDNAVFFALGEMTEIEDGLDPRDIEVIMEQLSVDRNVAIKALRKTGCLLDAIFEVGNDI